MHVAGRKITWVEGHRTPYMSSKGVCGGAWRLLGSGGAAQTHTSSCTLFRAVEWFACSRAC